VLLTHRDRDKLIAIEEALARVRDGSYGVCESCDEPRRHDRESPEEMAEMKRSSVVRLSRDRP
jgi:RNA polymerase-binding transcription factor DksA